MRKDVLDDCMGRNWNCLAKSPCPSCGTGPGIRLSPLRAYGRVLFVGYCRLCKATFNVHCQKGHTDEVLGFVAEIKRITRREP